jgi:hypothetical protein
MVEDSSFPGSPQPGLEQTSAEQMKMEMRHCLAGVRPVIGDDPIATIVEPVLGGDARR